LLVLNVSNYHYELGETAVTMKLGNPAPNFFMKWSFHFCVF